MAHVLVAEGDDATAAALVAAVRRAGHSCRRVPDGVAAVDALAHEALDAVVLALGLPRLDGFGVLVARARRQLAPQAVVVVLTVRADERSRARAWELGCDEYLVKPFDPDEVVVRLGGVLAAPAAEREERRRLERSKALVLEQVEATLHNLRRTAR